MLAWAMIAFTGVCLVFGIYYLKPSLEPAYFKGMGAYTISYAIALTIATPLVVLSNQPTPQLATYLGGLLGTFALFGLSGGIALLVGGDLRPVSYFWSLIAAILLFYAITASMVGFSIWWVILLALAVIAVVLLVIGAQGKIWAAKPAGIFLLLIAANGVYLTIWEVLLPLIRS
jgi:hypothetical protein